MEESTFNVNQNRYAAFLVALAVLLLIPVVYVSFFKSDEPPKRVIIQQRVEAPPLIEEEKLNEQTEQAETVASEESYVNLALTYYTANRYRECIYFSRKALQINPRNVIAYNNICCSYNGLQNWDSAIIAGNAALSIDPGYQLAKNNIQWALSMKQQGK